MDKCIDIPRSGNPAAIIALLPVIMMPVFRLKAVGFDLSFFLYLGSVLLAIGALLWAGFYQRRTPLLRIERKSLIFFGYAPSQKREFPLDGITKIKFFRRLSFWRSARRLVIEVNSEIHHLWLPHSWADQTANLHQMLREQFKEKYEEVLV